MHSPVVVLLGTGAELRGTPSARRQSSHHVALSGLRVTRKPSRRPGRSTGRLRLTGGHQDPRHGDPQAQEETTPSAPQEEETLVWSPLTAGIHV